MRIIEPLPFIEGYILKRVVQAFSGWVGNPINAGIAVVWGFTAALQVLDPRFWAYFWAFAGCAGLHSLLMAFYKNLARNRALEKFAETTKSVLMLVMLPLFAIFSGVNAYFIAIGAIAAAGGKAPDGQRIAFLAAQAAFIVIGIWKLPGKSKI
ncbi:MAG: hypothetical protein V1787_05890 [Candidatus Micrarchaeota archaeon]